MRTFYRDLGRVGIAKREGRDFHALRVTFGTDLARNKVPLALAQKLMRHSTPSLTSKLYVKFPAEDERSAIEGLDPGPHDSPGERETA